MQKSNFTTSKLCSWLALLFFIANFTAAHAQKIGSVSFDIIGDSCMAVKYNFIGSRYDTGKIDLYAAPNGKGKLKPVPSSELSGDVGYNVKMGNDKNLLWKPAKGFDFKGIKIEVKLSGTQKVDFTEMAFIEGGSFMMGSPETEVKRDPNEVQHKVTLSSFYMSKYVVTQKQWHEIMGTDPSNFKDCEKCPVEMVTFDDVMAFIKKLNDKTNLHYRLPTEAEWEYAARAGTTTVFYTGDNLSTKQANYNGNYPYNGNPRGKNIGKTCPVGSYPPNAWGLYDMAGNVYQWCSDWFDPYDLNQTTDPSGPSKGQLRVIRGGSWFDLAQYCRSANRYYYKPEKNRYSLGIRLVRD